MDHLNFTRRELRERLARLPGECEPPFDFAELQRRGAALDAANAGGTQRLSPPRAAGIAAALGGVLLGVTLWQQFARDVPATAAPPPPLAAPVEAARDVEPALVRVGTRAAAGDIEDRIAFVDDLLSESRLQGAPGDGLAMLEHNRSQLLASLEKLHYAEQLLNQ